MCFSVLKQEVKTRIINWAVVLHNITSVVFSTAWILQIKMATSLIQMSILWLTIVVSVMVSVTFAQQWTPSGRRKHVGELLPTQSCFVTGVSNTHLFHTVQHATSYEQKCGNFSFTDILRQICLTCFDIRRNKRERMEFVPFLLLR